MQAAKHVYVVTCSCKQLRVLKPPGTCLLLAPRLYLWEVLLLLHVISVKLVLQLSVLLPRAVVTSSRCTDKAMQGALQVGRGRYR